MRVRNFFFGSAPEGPLHAIRHAEARDMEAVARLFRAVRLACLPYLPDLHTPEEDTCFFRDRVFAECKVLLAEAETVDGFIAFRDGWIDHLYVRPQCQRGGIGKRLLTRATESGSRLRLWVFQRNTAAIAFYQSQGFRELERTDGSSNEEREPDMLMEWRA